MTAMGAKHKTIRHRPTPKRIKADDKKFRELILLIAQRSEGDPRFGALKLNKLLFYADFLAYARFGKPITGQEYFALPQGPAPKYMVPIREKMIKSGEIAIRERETLTGIQERTFALREPDLSKFTPEEVNLISSLVQRCFGHTAKYLSELTHKFAGWQFAKEKETIPYSVALVSNRAPTAQELKHGADLEAPAAACLAKYAAAAI